MEQEAIPPAVLKVAQALVASGIDLHDGEHVQAKARTRPYRVAEVAEILDVHYSTVYRDIEDGTLGAYRVGKGRGTIRIPVEDFETYRAGRKLAAVRQPVQAGAA